MNCFSQSVQCAPLTDHDGGDGEEDKAISLEKAPDVLPRDVLDSLLGPVQSGLDAILDALEPPSPLLRVLPVALGHGSVAPCRPAGAGCLELGSPRRVNKDAAVFTPQRSVTLSLSLSLLALSPLLSRGVHLSNKQ